MTIVLDDITGAEKLYPFGQVKSIAHIRIGALTIREKWQYFFDRVLLLSENEKPEGEKLVFSAADVPSLGYLKRVASGGHVRKKDFATLEHAADIFKNNEWALRQDIEMMTENKISQPLPRHVFATAGEHIFIEKDARVNPCFINAASGPVYISAHAEIMEGAMLRGPLFIGENSVVKMGAKIYGGTTIGPHCLAGGEIKNTVLMGYSNKAHDGYLGDSVIGEWCNLGAGTSNSNLKNNASDVLIYSIRGEKSVNAGKKCGLIMGDFSRSAINTSFNTGTVVGVSCNVIGGKPEKFVPDFSWGNERYDFEKALRDINNWKMLKGLEITDEEKISLKTIYNKNEKTNCSR